jgi:hypothetical protein
VSWVERRWEVIRGTITIGLRYITAMRSETLLSSRRLSALRLARGVLVAALLAACSDSPTTPAIPDTPAGIAGRVTSIVSTGNFSGRVLVEFNPGSPNTGPKALVNVTGTTKVFVVRTGNSTAYDGNGEFRSFAVGQWVRVWFTGPVQESYPVQGTAGTVVIDSLGVSVVP